jgi:HipA-like protein
MKVIVYFDGRRVGALSSPIDRQAPCSFAYDESVLGDHTAAVRVRLPIRATPYAEHEALPCCENLLPDGDVRDLLTGAFANASYGAWISASSCCPSQSTRRTALVGHSANCGSPRPTAARSGVVGPAFSSCPSS